MEKWKICLKIKLDYIKHCLKTNMKYSEKIYEINNNIFSKWIEQISYNKLKRLNNLIGKN